MRVGVERGVGVIMLLIGRKSQDEINHGTQEKRSDIKTKKPASSHRHTEAIHYTHKVKVGTKKHWKFTADGAWHDMFISSHPEDIRSQLS